MKIHLIKISTCLVGSGLILCSCSTAKLEARLEANPQCKDVMNPKTGALMPCPGSDKAFYREVGIAPTKPTPVASNPIALTPSTSIAVTSVKTPLNNVSTSAPVGSTRPTPAQVECKPQIHKKTGGTLPCPAPD
jgi:hypothetical protein